MKIKKKEERNQVVTQSQSFSFKNNYYALFKILLKKIIIQKILIIV